MTSKEFEQLSRKSQQQYFKLYIKMIQFKNKKVRWRPCEK